MRLICVSGIRGSGKTSLIKLLIERASKQGLRSSVIVNESGQAIYDADFADRHKIPVEYIRGG